MSHKLFMKGLRNDKPMISIQHHAGGNKRMAMNRAALILIGDPAKIKIFFDEENYRLKVVATDITDPNGYLLGKFGQIHMGMVIRKYDIPDQRMRPIIASGHGWLEVQLDRDDKKVAKDQPSC